jgi:predicted transglutaminase-like cysteine proteinase
MFTRTTALAALAALALGLPARAAPVDLDHGGQRLLDQVNRGVNRAFAPLAPFADPDGDGVWDCENYAAEKLARLRNAGVDADAVSLWRVDTSRGESHAVLVVQATRRGQPVSLVLDNLSEWTVARDALPYSRWQPLVLGPGAAVTAVTGRR